MNLKPSTNKAGLEKAIDDLISELEHLEGNDPQYAAIVDQMTKLHKLKTEESSKPVDPNQLIAIGGQLFGILMIIHHERVNVITSKALTYIPKLR